LDKKLKHVKNIYMSADERYQRRRRRFRIDTRSIAWELIPFLAGKGSHVLCPILGGQLHPTTRGRGPSAPQFWWFPSNYAYILRRRTTIFWFLGDSRGWGPGSPVLEFPYICVYCVHPLSQNYQI